MNFHKFIPLVKMEEQADGSLNVYGIVTAEQPDLDNEVCDYAGTKPFYQAKVASTFKLTSGIEGMEPSIMPMREMHQLIAIGAGRTIDFDDVNKTIRMGFNVVDPVAIQKFKKGVLIGFSQGGAYVGALVADPVHKGCKRYVADPAEVSGVDSPCLPAALVESMKGRTVTLAKADGTTEAVPFEIPSTSDLRMMKVENAVALLAGLFKREFSHQQREHDAGTGAALPDGSFPIENEGDLRNAIHAYGRASDKDKAKQHIIARAKSLGLTHLLPEGWGSAKAASDTIFSDEGDFTMAKITDLASMQKAAKTIHDHLEKHMEMHKALHEKLEGTMAKDHPIVKAHQAMMDHCEKCMKAAKDTMDANEPEPDKEKEAEKAAKAAADAATAAAAAAAAPADAITKAVTAAIAPFVEKVDALEKKFNAAPATQNMPSTGAVSVSKSVTADAAFGELIAK